MSPRGRPLTQARVAELAAGPGPLIVCGRFEGIDQRFPEKILAGGLLTSALALFADYLFASLEKYLRRRNGRQAA